MSRDKRMSGGQAMNDFPNVDIDAARLRPKFKLDLLLPPDEAMQRIRQGFDTPELRGTTMSAGRHAEFHVDEQERKVWSPRLTVQVEDAPGGSSLRGRFAPRADVWTGFMFVYFLVVFLILFGATLGYVQQVSDETPWGYWAIPVGLLVVGLIHGLSYLGQRLAEDQMRALRAQLESVLTGQFGSASDSDSDQENCRG
jgi:hypothetical protein